MPPSRLKFLLGQLGPKPGAARQLARCLTDADLDAFQGPFHPIDQRTWRTGSTGATEWGVRAGKAGSVTAWRSFRSTWSGRSLWVQLTPLATAEDGPPAVEAALDSMLPNPRAKVRLIAHDPVEPPGIAGASAVKAVDQRTTGGINRLLLYAVGSDFVTLAASGGAEQPWSWAEVAELGARQRARLG